MVADYRQIMNHKEKDCLSAAGLNIGTRLVAGLNDKIIRENLNLNKDEDPLYIMPLGYAKEK